MVSHCDVEVLESIIRSFEGEQFTTENVNAAMRNLPPRRRIEPRLASGLMLRLHLAEQVGKECIQVSYRWKMTTVWRPLI